MLSAPVTADVRDAATVCVACRAGGRQEGSAFDHDRDMSDTDSCISSGEYLGEPCDSFDDTDGGHLPHIHYHERYNYLPMTEDMAEHVRLDAWRECRG
jgi:hypothetical protein